MSFVKATPRQRNNVTSKVRDLAKLIGSLTLIGVVPLRADEYRVQYTFTAKGRGKCDGVAIVRTIRIEGANLIESIKALNGC